jgi:N-carbamoylputrescine amidase
VTVIRAALTETRNAYAPMPATVDELDQLAGRLDDVRDANLAHHVELASIAAGAGVQLICFGELFALPYFALSPNPMWIRTAEDAATGPTVSRCRELAREHRIAIVAPIYELDDGLRFDTAVVIAADGEIAGRYRKTHIPAGANEQNTFCETFYYGRAEGDNLAELFPVFDLGDYKLGVAICYDRHFTGVMRALADHGAEIVVSPAVSFGAKSERMWQHEFETDACRENLFIGGSNRRGAEPPWNQEYFGASHFVGPNGRPPPIDVHPDLVVADLDLSELRAPDPSGWDLKRDRRL